MVGGSSQNYLLAENSYFERAHIWGYIVSYSAGEKLSPIWSKATVYPQMPGFQSETQDQTESINALGATAGSGISQAPLYREPHGFYNIPGGAYGPIGVVYQKSTAHSISDANAVTGGAQYSSSGTYTSGNTLLMTAYVFKNGGFSAWAGQLPGGTLSEGYAINGSSLVVGRAVNSAGQTRAFSWNGTVSGGIKDLGTLGGTYSVARSVNDAGYIVGTSTNSAGAYRAFVYVPADAKMYDLNSYLANPQSGWTIVDAYKVNAKGQVLVRATNTSGAGAYWVLSINGLDQDSASTAAEFISPNSKTNASVGVAGDNDYFRVVLPEAGTFTMQTTGTTDAFCHLYNSANTELATHDNNSSTDKNCTISRYLTAGTYFLRTRHYYSTGTGSYTLLTGFSAENGNDKEHGTTVPVVSTTSAAIDVAADVDFFTVYLNAAKTMTVKTTGVGTYCALQSTNGSLLADTSGNAGENVNCSRTYSVASPGIYRVKVKHSSTTGTGAYSLVLQ